ncbi:MAG: hypothetical protein OK442_04370 [Thaumarchaeota archaeon]|nr:hypothetical protein [Nitrososphaerota archaeon]
MKLLNRKAISPKMMGAAIVLVGLLVGGGAFYAGQAFANPPPQTPTAVTGAMTGTYLPSSFLNSSTVSNQGVAPFTVSLYAPTWTMTGGITGTLDCYNQVVVAPDGVTLTGSNAYCTFTGTVTGGRGPGTMSVTFESSGSFVAPTPEGSYAGLIAFSQGTGGLRNIQSITGTIEGVINPPPPFGYYQDAGIYTGLVVSYN